MDSKVEARRNKKNEYMRQDRVDKADAIRDQRKQTIKCDCGLEVCKGDLLRNQNNKLHTQELERRRQLLEERTTPDIANLILSSLQVAFCEFQPDFPKQPSVGGAKGS